MLKRGDGKDREDNKTWMKPTKGGTKGSKINNNSNGKSSGDGNVNSKTTGEGDSEVADGGGAVTTI